MIKLFWYSKAHLNRGLVTNYGDEISKDIVEYVSGDTVRWYNPKEQSLFQSVFTTHVLAIDSILHFGAKNSLIWGAGLIDSKSEAPNAKYFAVRGKYTRKELINRGYKVPEVYGDPGLLMSKFLPKMNDAPKFVLGVIPHYVEFDEVNNWYRQNGFTDEILMIDLRGDKELILNQIQSCKTILSSSLHGIIIPQAYGIPTLRVSFSNKIIGDGIKYHDYFDSVGIENYEPTVFDIGNFTDINLNTHFQKHAHLGQINNDLIKIQDRLISARPF